MSATPLFPLLALVAAEADAVNRLHASGAHAPESARSVSADDAEYLASSLTAGLVRRTPNGGYYVDRDRYAAWRAQLDGRATTGSRLGLWAAVGAVVLAGLVVFMLMRGQ
ncbi:MAG: hypothetical protein IT361_10340 [Gemmatimonadaceae bacterium]|nr:hypothetical protein [Gemmatimonadaceae bacterium]